MLRHGNFIGSSTGSMSPLPECVCARGLLRRSLHADLDRRKTWTFVRRLVVEGICCANPRNGRIRRPGPSASAAPRGRGARRSGSRSRRARPLRRRRRGEGRPGTRTRSSTSRRGFRRANEPATWEHGARTIACEDASRLLVDAALAGTTEAYVQPSVTFVYPAEGPVDEDTPIGEVRPHLKSSLAAEQQAARFAGAGRRGVVLRLGLLDGPGTGQETPDPRAGRRSMSRTPDGRFWRRSRRRAVSTTSSATASASRTPASSRRRAGARASSPSFNWPVPQCHGDRRRGDRERDGVRDDQKPVVEDDSVGDPECEADEEHPEVGDRDLARGAVAEDLADLQAGRSPSGSPTTRLWPENGLEHGGSLTGLRGEPLAASYREPQGEAWDSRRHAYGPAIS